MNERRYTTNGEWLEQTPQGVKIGLTQSVVDDLGDVTFVGLPSIGQKLAIGDTAVSLEAVKAAQDLASPVEGIVAEVNDSVANDPSLLNRAPETEAWLIVLSDVTAEAWGALLNAEDWRSRTQGPL